MDKRAYIISPVILVVVYLITMMLVIQKYAVNDILNKGLLLQTGMMVYDISEEKRDMDFENFVSVTALGAASELDNIEAIESRIRDRVFERYNLDVDVDVNDVSGNLTIEVSNSEIQEEYVLGYPFTELSSIELDMDVLDTCISGCSCSDMSYLNRLIYCVDAMENERYNLSFSEESGCSDNRFEAIIYVSKANNTLSTLFPHALNNASAIRLSC